MRIILVASCLVASSGVLAAECLPVRLPPPGSKRPDIVAAVMPAVVQVQGRYDADNAESFEEVLGDANRETQASNKQSLGSGFIISGDGLVVTNEHVIARARQITVRLADGSVRGATLLGRDERIDIAILRMEALRRCYPSLTWADSDKARVGANVTAVGSPFGLGGSVTAGIISGRGRSLGSDVYNDFLQIDAAINQGNSGGPLLDESGQVIGINTAILSPAGGNIGIGFSLPSTMARRVVAELLQHGRTSRTQLGLSLENLTGDMAEALGLPSSRGVLVLDVTAGSPAEAAGMSASDVILAVDGRLVSDLGALSAEVASFAAGRAVKLDVWRAGAATAVELVPAAKSNAAARTRQLQQKAAPDGLISHGGMLLAGTTSALNIVAGQSPTANGLIVIAVEPDGPAASRGIAVGDIITGVAGKPLISIVQFTDAIDAARAAGRRNLLITLQHGSKSVWLAIPVKPGE